MESLGTGTRSFPARLEPRRLNSGAEIVATGKGARSGLGMLECHARVSSICQRALWFLGRSRNRTAEGRRICRERLVPRPRKLRRASDAQFAVDAATSF